MKKGLFFVFNDLTAKNDTYPGGRFLDTGPDRGWKCRARFQSRLQSSVRRDSLCDVSVGPEGEPPGSADNGWGEVRQGRARPPEGLDRLGIVGTSVRLFAVPTLLQ